MNHRVTVSVLGTVIKLLGVSMIAPLLVAVYYHENIRIFLTSSAIALGFGILLERVCGSEFEELGHRESFVIVAIGWLCAAFFGSIPYVLSGISPLDSFFESMSGFTTTGSTILNDIESYSRSLLFWRSMTQWLGGMGIIVLVIAILPKLAIAGRQMFNSESPGPFMEKLKPRLKDTAQILWGVYIGFTVLEIILLKYAGATLYDAVLHTFSTMATGGFSPRNQSIAAFGNPWIEVIITIFMFIAGANFSLFYRTLRVNPTSLIKDKEFQAYFFIMLISIFIVSYKLYHWGDTLFESLRYAGFQVVSIMTTTGFTTTDFNQWHASEKIILLMLMFIGGSAGSTGGGIKVIRVILLLKFAIRGIYKAIHPKMVKPIMLGNTSISDEVMHAILSFFVLYLLVFVGSTLILSMLGIDMITSISASATTLGNVGPGLNLVGPMENFSSIPMIGKITLILNMWIGRLEVFTVLILFVPSFWKE